jgi:methyl-accepting chemotaxis protein
MKSFANTAIGTRLAIGFSVILILSFLTSGIALWRLNLVAQGTQTMMTEPLAKERFISDWYRVIHTAVRRTAAIARSTDPSLGTYFAKDAAESTQYASDMQKKVEALLVTDAEKKLFEEIGEQRKI